MELGAQADVDDLPDWYDAADSRDQFAAPARRLSISRNLLPADCVLENMPQGVSKAYRYTTTPPHAGSPGLVPRELPPGGPGAPYAGYPAPPFQAVQAAPSQL